MATRSKQQAQLIKSLQAKIAELEAKAKLTDGLQAKVAKLESDAKTNDTKLRYAQHRLKECEAELFSITDDFDLVFQKFSDAVLFIGRMKTNASPEVVAEGAALAQRCLNDMEKSDPKKRKLCSHTMDLLKDCVDMFKVRYAGCEMPSFAHVGAAVKAEPVAVKAEPVAVKAEPGVKVSTGNHWIDDLIDLDEF